LGWVLLCLVWVAIIRKVTFGIKLIHTNMQLFLEIYVFL